MLQVGATGINGGGGSSLERDTDYPGRGFRCFRQCLHINPGIVPRLGDDYFLPDPSQFINHSIIRRYSLDTDSVIK
jgi:hypothetical protein